ncbi:iron-sulfur cluster carrier protein ApbC [Vibrio penaeicida]|uniref:iron-sulfur cluster carrier protein ApbC n=1 Tax=Vibrio penaeicida TaxID=104609 RepID=UPI0027365E0C|nr:iron-sulfur cluster carrier protein ApbC [Vibrio penaeicida]MDP2570925.1 iron-sulfur cluster carrier protein ApbC [Vibrio penaeicida]
MEQFQSKEALCQWLGQYRHPMLIDGWSQTLGIVSVLASGVIKIEIPFINKALQQSLKNWIEDQIKSSSIPAFEYNIVGNVKAMQTTVLAEVKGVKNIIAVTSAKGGVGKSTTAVNLAMALNVSGAKVGMLDADIYGPSVPIMLGTQGKKPDVRDNKWMQPVQAHGVYTNSIGYLVDDADAAIWRGPMASKALAQLLNETEWPDLDYLVIDMPPGTGDIQLTLSQQIPVTGSLIVTTPQDLALADARKGAAMFEKVDVPVLGMVENMSYHICSHCGEKEHIFGDGGASQMAQEFGLALLAQIPLHISVREDLDNGAPTVVSRPDSPHSDIYRLLAETVVSRLYWQGKAKPDAISFVAV